MNKYVRHTALLATIVTAASMVAFTSETLGADSRFATADSRGRYVHVIDLVDANFRKVDPTSESPRPYSPRKTCGKCHDYDTISHGWHFNAMMGGDSGRRSEPWIWTDERTGTHIPLTYRDWKVSSGSGLSAAMHPDRLGITPFQMTEKFGGHFPGGGPGHLPEKASASSKSKASEKEDAAANEGESEEPPAFDRFTLAGELAIDCLMCHSNDRSYSPTERMHQIDDQNFAWAPSVAAGLATVSRRVRSVKDGSDPKDEAIQKKMPLMTYDPGRFRPDGKVFFDIRRKPSNESCYHCHTVLDVGAGSRWTHDGDVHLQAGMNCIDCHRNGIDHATVRGFEGQNHANATANTLSCRGCHLGEPEASDKHHAFAGGRLGSPKPLHKGIPPIHFEKMSCTACHSGPVPGATLTRRMTSKAHRLGEKEHRGDQPSPAIVAPVFLRTSAPAEDSSSEGLYTPHNMAWPAFWGTIVDGEIQPLNPEAVYDATRRALAVRSDFDEEMQKIRLPLSVKRELLGEERGKLKEDQWTEEEKQKVAAKTEELAELQVAERMVEAMLALKKSDETIVPVYVSGGKAWQLSGDGLATERITDDKLLAAAQPYAWPLGHDVRPARWSLGITGCTECHSEDAPIFYGSVTAIGTLPDRDPVTKVMHQWQGGEPERLSAWNQMFEGRSNFKYASFAAIGIVILIALAYLLQFVSGTLNRVTTWLVRPKAGGNS